MGDTPSETILNMHEIREGITTSILSPTKPITSLRRTLSVDMSSRNWISRDGLPSKRLDHLSNIEDKEGTASDDEEGSRIDIWNLIQEDKRKALSQDQQTGEFDVWSSITSRNTVRPSKSETIPPQYVPLLVRRSSSCLSEKSLEICTESLGSETGSDGFSLSETRGLFGPPESEGEKNESLLSSAFGRTYGVLDFDAQLSFHTPAAIPRKKQRPRSFPPPLPSLSPAADGASLLMRSRRGNGRLVLEAISVRSQKNFQARRENGGLMLAVTTPDVEPGDCDFIPDRSTDGQEEVDGGGGGGGGGVYHGDDVAEKEGAAGQGIEWIIRKKTESAVEIATSSPHIDYIGKLKIPKITINLNKPDEVSKVVFFNEINEGEVEINSVPIKLPQPLRAPAANHLNLYEYIWRTKPCTTAAAVTNHSETTQPPFTLKSYRNTKKYVFSHNNCNSMSNDRQEVQILFKDNNKNIMENCWVSVMIDNKRSLYFLPPHSIATS